MKYYTFNVIRVCLILILFAITPIYADWEQPFSNSIDLESWEVSHGSFAIEDNCLQSMDNYNSMWFNSTATTGSWRFSIQIDTAFEKASVYLIVADDEISVNGVPSKGVFMIFNGFQNNDNYTATSVELMTRNGDEIHHIGSKTLTYRLKGWQHLAITRTTENVWNLFLNSTLLFAPGTPNNYQSTYVDWWQSSNFFNIQADKNIEFALFNHEIEVRHAIGDPLPNMSTICPTTTPGPLIDPTSERNAPISFVSIISSLIIISYIMIKKKEGTYKKF